VIASRDFSKSLIGLVSNFLHFVTYELSVKDSIESQLTINDTNMAYKIGPKINP
jgi:hypothetical protein